MKKILCVLLSVMLLLPTVAVFGAGKSESAPAAQIQTESGEKRPFLLVRGMLFAGLTYKAGTDEARNAFSGINAFQLLKALGKAVSGGLWKRDINVFTDTLVDYARDLMGLMACDKNGQPKYDTTVETYEQSELNKEQLGDALNYLMENMEVSLQSFKGRIIGVTLPNSVNLKVVECEPSVKGNTATGATKMAKVETGYEVRVPLFVNEGDTLRIDTRTGNYIERA